MNNELSEYEWAQFHTIVQRNDAILVSYKALADYVRSVVEFFEALNDSGALDGYEELLELGVRPEEMITAVQRSVLDLSPKGQAQ